MRACMRVCQCVCLCASVCLLRVCVLCAVFLRLFSVYFLFFDNSAKHPGLPLSVTLYLPPIVSSEGEGFVIYTFYSTLFDYIFIFHLGFQSLPNIHPYIFSFLFFGCSPVFVIIIHIIWTQHQAYFLLRSMLQVPPFRLCVCCHPICSGRYSTPVGLSLRATGFRTARTGRLFTHSTFYFPSSSYCASFSRKIIISSTNTLTCPKTYTLHINITIVQPLLQYPQAHLPI